MQCESNYENVDFPTLHADQCGWGENSKLIVEDLGSMTYMVPHYVSFDSLNLKPEVTYPFNFCLNHQEKSRNKQQ